MQLNYHLPKKLNNGLPLIVVPTSHSSFSRQTMLDHLFELLAPYFNTLFPPGSQAEQPVWQFLAALALHASTEQQQILVASLREKVLENVTIAQNYMIPEDEQKARLGNVNLFFTRSRVGQ